MIVFVEKHDHVSLKTRRCFFKSIVVFLEVIFPSSFYQLFSLSFCPFSFCHAKKVKKNLLKYTVKVSNNGIYFYIYRY